MQGVSMNINPLDPKLIVLVVVLILILAIAAVLHMRKRKTTTAALREKFGPEYKRALLVHGSERKAEAALADREKRVEKLSLRDLDPTERERYLEEWTYVQSRFVDSPQG